MNPGNPALTPGSGDISRLSSEHEFRFRPQELSTIDSLRSPDSMESLRHPLQVPPPPPPPPHSMYPPPFGTAPPGPPTLPTSGAPGIGDYPGPLPGTPLQLFQSRPEYASPPGSSAFLPGYMPAFPGGLGSAAAAVGTPGLVPGPASHLDGHPHLMDHHSLNALAAVAAVSNNNGPGLLGDMQLPNVAGPGGVPGSSSNPGPNGNGQLSGGQSPQSAGGQMNSDNGLPSDPQSPNVMYPWMSIVG